MNKRGISSVIASILLILIAIVAVILIWTILRTFFSSSGEQVELGRVFIDLEIVDKNTQVSTDGVVAKVKRNKGLGELAGIRFSIENESDSYIFDADANMKEFEERTFTISITGQITDVIKISIAPIINTTDGKLIYGRVLDVFEVSGQNIPQVICGDGSCNIVEDCASCSQDCGSCPPGCTDGDGDLYNVEGGSCGVVDCDDNNAAINPAAVEICGNGIDENCDGIDDACPPVCESDCTYNTDNICHSACNNVNGCSLKSGCDGISAGTNICTSPNQPSVTICCEAETFCQPGLCCASGQCSVPC